MGQPKLLLEWQGKTLVRRAAETAIESGAAPVILVSGPYDTEMRRELAGLPMTVVHNPDYAAGMSTSLRTGIAALSDDVAGAIVMLSDQPLVSSDVLVELASNLGDPEALIVQPRYDGKPGNPVGFNRGLFRELQSQVGDQGAREMLRARRSDIRYVDFDNAALQQDIDTPEDFEALRRR
jgi:molybdenum cofactor cytidylyltransferase